MILPDGYSDDPNGKIAAVTTHLEMTARPAPRPDPAGGWSVRHVETPPLDWYRDLYRRVGEDWLWTSRMRLPDAELSAIIRSPSMEIHARSPFRVRESRRKVACTHPTMEAPSWDEPAGSAASRIHLSPTATGVVGKVAGMSDADLAGVLVGVSDGIVMEPSGAIWSRTRWPAVCRVIGATPLVAPLVTKTNRITGFTKSIPRRRQMLTIGGATKITTVAFGKMAQIGAAMTTIAISNRLPSPCTSRRAISAKYSKRPVGIRTRTYTRTIARIVTGGARQF